MKFREEDCSLSINGIEVYHSGAPTNFDANAVSKQLGAAALLRAMADNALIVASGWPMPAPAIAAANCEGLQ